jgi:hypothetical protein
MGRKKFVHLFEGLAGYMPDFGHCTELPNLIPTDVTYGLEEHYINIHDEDPPEDDLAFLEEALRKHQDAIVYCQHPHCLFYVSIEFYDEEEHSRLGCELNEEEQQ